MGQHQVVSELLAQMRAKGGLPSLSSAPRRLSQMGDGGATCSTEELAAIVLEDLALTRRVLTAANSQMYSAFGPVAGVRQAVFVLGTAAVTHLAQGLPRVEDSLAATGRTTWFYALAQAKLAADLAGALSTAGRFKDVDAEDAMLRALMSNLGEVLLSYYLPETWDALEAAGRGCITEDVALDVLGISLPELVKEALADWGLPAQLAANIGSADAHSWAGKAAASARAISTAYFSGAATDHIEHAFDDAAASLNLDPHKLRWGLQRVLAESEAVTAVQSLTIRTAKRREEILSRAYARIAAAPPQTGMGALTSEVLTALREGLGLRRVALAMRQQGRLVARAGAGADHKGLVAALNDATDPMRLAMLRGFEKGLAVVERESRPGMPPHITVPLMVEGKAIAVIVGEWAYSASSESGLSTTEEAKALRVCGILSDRAAALAKAVA